MFWGTLHLPNPPNKLSPVTVREWQTVHGSAHRNDMSVRSEKSPFQHAPKIIRSRTIRTGILTTCYKLQEHRQTLEITNRERWCRAPVPRYWRIYWRKRTTRKISLRITNYPTPVSEVWWGTFPTFIKIQREWRQKYTRFFHFILVSAKTSTVLIMRQIFFN